MTPSRRTFEDPTIAAHQRVRIGDAVKRARQAIGYSLDDLAETCGLTDVEISRIEIGADADQNRLRRIAVALKVEPSTFLTI